MDHPGIGSRMLGTTDSLCSHCPLRRELVASGSSCHMLLRGTVLTMAFLLRYTLCILFVWPYVSFGFPVLSSVCLYWGVSVLWKCSCSLCLDTSINHCWYVAWLPCWIHFLVGFPPPKKVRHRYPLFQTSTKWNGGLHHPLTPSRNHPGLEGVGALTPS